MIVFFTEVVKSALYASVRENNNNSMSNRTDLILKVWHSSQNWAFDENYLEVIVMEIFNMLRLIRLTDVGILKACY